MTELLKILRSRIEGSGPITVAEFMGECLCHPHHGYYMNRDPFGKDGDFTTAPEISQMFGELLGLWAAVMWQQMGSPLHFRLVELGPGRGTLMSDALRALRGIPECFDALDVHLVEISPVLRKKQDETLKNCGKTVHWHTGFNEVPDGPCLVIANEFFDALPIRQFENGEKGWSERLVDIDPDGDGLRFVLRKDETALALMPQRLQAETAEGSIFEFSSMSQAICDMLADRFKRFGGAVVALDYGHVKSGFGDTFQALKGHKFHPVLQEPGHVDVTAHVDFEMLHTSFEQAGATCWGPMEQGEFLNRLGLGQRAQALLQVVQPSQQEQIISAYQRLSAPDQMGQLFKVLVATHPDFSGPPPAFEDEG